MHTSVRVHMQVMVVASCTVFVLLRQSMLEAFPEVRREKGVYFVVEKLSVVNAVIKVQPPWVRIKRPCMIFFLPKYDDSTLVSLGIVSPSVLISGTRNGCSGDAIFRIAND